MKRILFLLALCLPLWAQAQEKQPAAEYLRRYNQLTQRVGAAGVGVETLLNKWEADWPEDVQQMLARFNFCFARSQSSRVIQLDCDRYLGQEPIIPFTDSLGNKKNFFEDIEYDDELFAESIRALDKAIQARPNRLDYRMARIDALIAYEKGTPDMGLQALKELTDLQFKTRTPWELEGMPTVDGQQFQAFMQDYCVALFRIGTDASQEAFKTLSDYLLTYCKDEPLFVNNLGSYYLVKRDFKKARKYIDKVLKKYPDDVTAQRNGLLLARALKDKKLEKKYRELMARSAGAGA